MYPEQLQQCQIKNKENQWQRSASIGGFDQIIDLLGLYIYIDIF